MSGNAKNIFITLIKVIAVAVVIWLFYNHNFVDKYDPPADVGVYKTECEPISDEELLRYPNDYKGKKVTMDGNVIQLLEDGKWNVAIVETNSSYVYVMYKEKDLGARLLQNDKIRFYGEFTELGNCENAITDEQVEMPKVLSYGIEIIE